MDLLEASLDEPDDIPIRRAGGKRSSILKQSKVLNELFEGEEVTIGRRSQGSKRVSFAETFQVKELLTGNIYDIPSTKEVPVLKENVPAKEIPKNLVTVQNAESCSSFEKNPFLDEPILPIHSTLFNISRAAETLIRKETSGDLVAQSIKSQRDNAYNEHSKPKLLEDMELTLMKSHHQSSNQLNTPDFDDICCTSKEEIPKLPTKPPDSATSKLFADDKENAPYYPEQSEVMVESIRSEFATNVMEVTCAETTVGDLDSNLSDLTIHPELSFDFKQINESLDSSPNVVNSNKENVYYPQPCIKRLRGHSYAKDPNLTKAVVSEMDLTCVADDEESLAESLTGDSKFLNQSMFFVNDRLKMSDLSDSSMMQNDASHHESAPLCYQTESNGYTIKDISFNKSEYHLEDMDMTCVVNESCLDRTGFKTLELSQAPPSLFATRTSEVHETLKVTQVIDIFQEVRTEGSTRDSDRYTYNSHEGSFYHDSRVKQRDEGAQHVLEKEQYVVDNNLVVINKPKGNFEAPIIDEKRRVSINEDIKSDLNAVKSLRLLAQSNNYFDETKKQIDEMDMTCLNTNLEEPILFAIPQNVSMGQEPDCPRSEDSREIAEQTKENEAEMTGSNMGKTPLRDTNEDLSIDRDCLSVSFPHFPVKELINNTCTNTENMAITCMDESIEEEMVSAYPKRPPKLHEPTHISDQSAAPSIVEESSLCVLPSTVMNENTSLMDISMQSNVSNLVMSCKLSESVKAEARSFLRKKLKCTPKVQPVGGLSPKNISCKFKNSQSPLQLPSINFKTLQMKMTRGPGVSGLNYNFKRSLLNSKVILPGVQMSPFVFRSRRKSRGFHTFDPETSIIEARAPHGNEILKNSGEKDSSVHPLLCKEEEENKKENLDETRVADNMSIDISMEIEENDKQQSEKSSIECAEGCVISKKEKDEVNQQMNVPLDSHLFDLEIAKDVECLQENLSNILEDNMLTVDSLRKMVSSPGVHLLDPPAIHVMSPELIPPVFNNSVEVSRSCDNITDMPAMLTCNFNVMDSPLSDKQTILEQGSEKLQLCEQSPQSVNVSLEQVADLDSNIVQISKVESPIPSRKMGSELRRKSANSPSFIIIKSPSVRTPSPIPRKRIRNSPVCEVPHSTKTTEADVQDNDFTKECAAEQTVNDISHVPCISQNKILPIPSQNSVHSLHRHIETSSLPFAESTSTLEAPLLMSHRKSLFLPNQEMPRQDDMASLSVNKKQSLLVPDSSLLRGASINCFDEQRPADIVAESPTSSAESSTDCKKPENDEEFQMNKPEVGDQVHSMPSESNFLTVNQVECNTIPDMSDVEIIGRTVGHLNTDAIENQDKRCPAVCNAPEESVKAQLVTMMEEAESHRWNPVKYSNQNAVLELTFGRLEHRCYVFVKIDFEHVDGWEISFEVNPKYTKDLQGLFNIKFSQRTLGYKMFHHRIKPVCLPAPSTGDALIKELKRIASEAKNIGMLTHDLVGVQSLVVRYTSSESIEPLVVQIECFNDKRSSKFEATFEIDVENYPAAKYIPKLKYLDYNDATEEILQLAQTLEAKVNPLFETTKLLFHN